MRTELDLGLYALASVVFFVDLIDLLVRLYLRRQNTIPLGPAISPATSVKIDVGTFTPYQMELHLRPFAVVASIYNASATLDGFLGSLGSLREHLWIVDDGSTDDTPAKLAAAGVRYVHNTVNGKKPAALRSLLRAIPAHVETIIVLDPDVRFLSGRDDIVRVLFEFQRSSMAALCPRIGASGQSWLAKVQRLEYWLAFSIGRKSLSDFSITSGAAVYRADALRMALEQHSLSVYAEDLENTLILLAKNESIYYDGRLVLETDAVSGVRRLFSQRVGWHYGLIRVYVARWQLLWRRAVVHVGFAYQFFVYLGVLTLLLHPFKIVALVLLGASFLADIGYLFGAPAMLATPGFNPLYFPLIYMQYLALVFFAMMVAVSRGERRQLLPIIPLYPLYALLQVIPATVGYLNWVGLRVCGRRIYRDHYEPALP
jgi:cellulose synthase/poly-beta-1,6-N-acetylglucosamine synthase-like glycosyltransferase